jgi:regulator of replication initiation timing
MTGENVFGTLRRGVEDLIEAAGAIPSDDDGAAAYAYVTDLADALRRLPELLALVPALADVAALGGTRRQRLEQWHEELQAREAEVAERLAELAQIRPIVDELRRRVDQRERLDAELTELRRLRSLGDSLETLREQHALMERRRIELEQVAAEERRLGEVVHELHALTSTELSGLRESLAEAVTETARLERETERLRAALAAERAKAVAEREEAARLAAEHDEARAEADRRLPSLSLHRQAERALVEGLARGSLRKSSGLRHAQRVMDEVEERLQRLDAALKDALKIHDDAHEQARKDVPLTGGA